MTKFLVDEFAKCLEAIKDSDPATPGYSYALQSMSLLDSLGDQIDTAVELVQGNATPILTIVPNPSNQYDASAPAEEPEPTPTPAPARTYTKADVRKALYNAKKQGVDLTEIFGRYGATNTNDLPESSYEAIVQAYGGGE